MRPVLELHLAGQTTPEAQAALAAHVPTCTECLSTLQAYAEPSASDGGAYPGPSSAYPAPAPYDARPSAPYGDPAAYPDPSMLPTPPSSVDPSAAYYDPSAQLAPLGATAGPSVADLEALARAQHAAVGAAGAGAAGPAPLPAADPAALVDPDDPKGKSVLPVPVRTAIDVALWGGFALVAAAAVLLVPDFLAPPELSSAERVAEGVRISDVRIARRRPNGEVVLLSGNTIAPKDRLVFSYVHTGDWERLIIFVTDETGEIYWQFPDWSDRRQPAYAHTILSDRKIQTIPVATHRDWAGKLLTVFTIFSKDFITTRQVEERLADPQRDATLPLFSGTLERHTLIAVDPVAADVGGVPQNDPDEFGTSKIDSQLKIEPDVDGR